MTKNPEREAMRALVEQQQHAVLCTAHTGLGGWPFGSIVPYALQPNGDALVFVSDIAEHTRNLRRDARASLFVADPAAAARPQAGARVTLLVRACRPADAEVAAAEACYFARFPSAASMREAHGFHVLRLEVDQVRWIGGYGAMGWFDRATWSGEADPLAAHAADIVAHMNEDHADAIVELVAWCGGVAAGRARVTGVDRGGFFATADGRDGEEHEVRLPFPVACTSPDAVRHATIALLHAARRARGG